MIRLLGLVATLLAIAYGAILADGVVNARCAVPSYLSAIGNAFEPADDRREAEAPLSPTDLNDDDDSNDDDNQEFFAEQPRVVASRYPVVRRASHDSETIRPALGHPPGIYDPPRS